MPKAGQILANPLTGDTYEFITTALGSNGLEVSMKATIHSKGPLVPNHIHLLQDETFEIISGKLTISTGNNIADLLPCEIVTLPRNVAHNHYNMQDEPAVYIHTMRPALDFDYFIENLVGLAADGKTKQGKASLMQQMVTLKYLDSKVMLADMPTGVQKLMFNTLGPIGRLMGYRAIYKKYSGIEK
jgi:quercetin dioxygenase-like cupin family protein